MAKSAVLVGGSGFVGRAVRAEFESAGYSVSNIGRSESGKGKWDAKTLGDWAELLENADVLVNLSGEPVAQKWTFQTMARIRESRVESTAALAMGIRSCRVPPKAWVNASAVGMYGNRGDEVLTEASKPGPSSDFLVSVCQDWENALFEPSLPETKRVAIRIGIVLGKDGGAFPTLKGLTGGFLGGSVGSGKQFMSWIHIADLAKAIRHCAESEVEGPVNGVGPNPVTNGDFMATMRKLMGKPWAPPAPSFGLRIASLFGAPEPEILLASTRVAPDKLIASGFAFQYSELENAIRSLL